MSLINTTHDNRLRLDELYRVTAHEHLIVEYRSIGQCFLHAACSLLERCSLHPYVVCMFDEANVFQLYDRHETG